MCATQGFCMYVHIFVVSKPDMLQPAVTVSDFSSAKK